MPKLDLKAAKIAKTRTANITAMKGKGWSWSSQQWTPTALFAGGKQGAYYDFARIDTLFQGNSEQLPVTASDQNVGYALDLSGNGNHSSQATPAKMPSIVIDGKKSRLSFDIATTNNDFFEIPKVIFPVGDFELSVAYVFGGVSSFILLTSAGGPNPYFGAGISGNNTTSINGSNASILELFSDGVSVGIPENRGILHNRIANASRFSMRANLSATNQHGIGLGKYQGSAAYSTIGQILGIVVRQGFFTAEERNKLDQFWANKFK